MMREHKAGLAVTLSFLGLVGTVIGLKLREPPAESAAAAQLPPPGNIPSPPPRG
jgi:hypothetical protein